MITRRQVLKAGAAAAATFMFGKVCKSEQGGGGAPFVRDDTGRLRKVLIHTLTSDEYTVDRESSSVVPNLEIDWESSARQQQEFNRLLGESGAETLELVDVLDDAIEKAKSRGVWQTWLSANHPRLSQDPNTVTASTLLGRDNRRQFQRWEDDTYRHSVSSAMSSLWTRDVGFMTPSGLVVCNFRSRRRLRESETFRFMISQSPHLSMYPIVFDAVAEGMIIEGGDAQLLDEKTLLLGVGQRTDPRIAQLLARRLNLDVVAVQIHKTEFVPRGEGEVGQLGQLRGLFLHLDSFFTHVGSNHVLTLPWLLEMKHVGKDPLTRFIRGARADLTLSSADADGALTFLKELGKVCVFRSGTGAQEDTGDMKLVDFIKAKGGRVTYLAGQDPDEDRESLGVFLRQTLVELRRQAANVVATAPSHVIAYSGSPLTKAALERDGVSVKTFEARELWARHGGPHCLTMPLNRD